MPPPPPSSTRSLPNILVTGTPTTGKTTLCETLISLAATATPPIHLQHLSINDVIKSSSSFHSGPSSQSNKLKDSSLTITDDNLDSLMDHISSSTLLNDGANGGFLIDWHSSSGFAVRWIDLVVILRCYDTSVFYDRLVARGYGDAKVQENLDAEIFGVVGEEVSEAWGGEDEEGGVGDGDGKVLELKSETAEDMEENAERVMGWIRKWVEERGKRGEGEG